MITKEDMEAMDCSIRPKTDEYSKWVETMILTSGERRVIENTRGVVGEAG